MEKLEAHDSIPGNFNRPTGQKGINMSRDSVFTRQILELEQALAESKKAFMKKFNEVNLSLNNCSCGDSFYQQAVQQVYRRAIEKYILV